LQISPLKVIEAAVLARHLLSGAIGEVEDRQSPAAEPRAAVGIPPQPAPSGPRACIAYLVRQARGRVVGNAV
jgi:hypothetical protein